MTSTEQWQLIKRIVDAALEKPTTERAAYLDATCPDDTIRAEVESLLAHEVSSFMAESAPGSGGPGSSSRLPAGTHLGNFEIVELIGSGGMGDVYRGTDKRLGRNVAIKVLPPEFAADPNRRSRFEQEARAAAALNHPHIAVVHDVGHEPVDANDPDGPQVHYIVQEFLDGQSLGSLMRKDALLPRQVVHMAVEITEALAAAHAAGIVHRDLKPDNVFVTRDGHAKLLDFGVAKLGPEFTERRDMTDLKTQHVTAAGGIVGTTAYMAPEQLRGQQVDSQADLWALGVLIYEMTAGVHPFLRETPADTASAILGNDAEPLDTIVEDAPPYLADVIDGLLQKDPQQRPSVGDMLAQLEMSRSTVSGEALAAALARRWRPSRRVVAAAGLVIAVAGIWAYSAWAEAARLSRARLELLPSLEALVDEFIETPWDTQIEPAWKALAVADEIRPVLGDDPALTELVNRVTSPMSLQSSPPGVQVRVRPYRDESAEWLELGTTPVSARPPSGFLEIQLRGDDLDPVDDVVWSGPVNLTYEIPSAGESPPGMALVSDSGRDANIWLATLRPFWGEDRSVDIPPFYIDLHEATNAEYKEFVDAGGYRESSYWPAFESDGATVSWADGLTALTDQSGRPGPAGWLGGSYVTGQGGLPVGGLSWYEAAAYCAWRGKELPTFLQWRSVGVNWLTIAADYSQIGDREGPVDVGVMQGVTRFGTRDMAGNVREWVYNVDAAGDRYILGGGWSDAGYLFDGQYAAAASDRSPINGVRCVQNLDDGDRLAHLRQPVVRHYRDPASHTPVTDDVFELLRGQFEYDRTDLEASVDEDAVVEEPEWTRETVSLQAAYGDERVIAHLLIPKGAQAPYQSVYFWPGAAGPLAGASEDRLHPDRIRSVWRGIVASGRVFVYPVLYDMHERNDDEPQPHFWLPNMERRAVEWSIRPVQDGMRILEYLQSRDDLDGERIGYMGASWGAHNAAFLLAVEHGFRAAVLSSAGLTSYARPPEMDHLNYLPRVRIPTLVLGGVRDWINPYEASQIPFYEALGSEIKEHVGFESGHSLPKAEVLRHALDWFDEHMGPVASASPQPAPLE